MEESAFTSELLAFLDASPTPMHAVALLAGRLEHSGFRRLREGDPWRLERGERCCVTRGDAALIAFCTGDRDPAEGGLRLAGAHSDSPGLKLKPRPVALREGFVQLGVEVYGGALLAPWFDRDLSLAGRVTCAFPGGERTSVLLDLGSPLAVIPSLAIHLDREVNAGRAINAQKDLPPVVMLAGDGAAPDFGTLLTEWLAQRRPEMAGTEVLDWDLWLYDSAPARITGLRGEFISGGRLDNLLSCFAAVEALRTAEGRGAGMVVINDHEEVGSLSRSGAGGPFLAAVLERLTGGGEAQARAMARSLLVSVDNAHAAHPNFPEKFDPNHAPRLNGGPVIKVNAGQRYASDSESAALFRLLCRQAGVPVQTFAMRADLACGSTIGPITAGRVGVRTVDVGVATLAMHSVRELAGSRDPHLLFRALERFFAMEAPPFA
jgi:aspartyl aminopeptidase